MSSVNPQRTIGELKELRRLTADEHGAQRVAFTDTWVAARDYFKQQLEGLPVTTHQDEAGNLWVTLPGTSTRELWIGGHLDSVPNGGWLDGCLNVFAGLEVLRRIADQYDGKPPVTVKLVDWCDEEGARFGRSLFGSSAVSGFFDPDDLRNRTDKDGVRLEDAARAHGIDLNTALEAGKAKQNAGAYIELHIEQGPVLESLELPLGVVMGTKGVERHAITFHGQEAHSGATPMTQRHDALGAAAKLALEIREIALQHTDAVCTVGSVKTFPGIVTAVVGRCEMTLDQRDLDAGVLQSMYEQAKDRIGALRQRRGLHSGVVKNLEHRTDPVPPATDRFLRRRDPRDRRGFAPLAIRPTARRRRDCQGRNSHRHDVRAIQPRHQPQQVGGHAGTAPRAVRGGV